jgi:hypothetical protein
MEIRRVGVRGTILFSPSTEPPARGVVRQYLLAAEMSTRRCADSMPIQDRAAEKLVDEARSDFEHDRQDHRPAAGAVVYELPDSVVQVLLEQLDLADVAGQQLL